VKLQRLDCDFSICKVNTLSGVDFSREFCFLSKTDEELSLVCLTQYAPANALERSDGWKGFRVQGVLDFSLVGVLSQISALLAAHHISLFAVSTYNTDYIFTKAAQFESALQALAAAGHEIH